MKHWISTAERLPEQNTTHLSLLEGDVATEAEMRVYIGNGEWVYLDGSKSDLPIAFWMEIPDAPSIPASRIKSDEEAADSLLGALFGGASSSPAPEAPREPDPIEPFKGAGGEMGGGGASASWDDNSGTRVASSDDSSSSSSDSGSSDSGSSESSDS